MDTTYRWLMIRVAQVYRNISLEAVLGIAGMPPLNLFAEERRNWYQGTERAVARTALLAY